MYDNINLRITKYDVSGINFLEETPQYFDLVTGQSNYGDKTVIFGLLGDFIVSASDTCLSIKDGSLCKYYLGDNFKTLQRADVQKAIERLSDTLHLPVEKATVTRLDIAQNFIVRYPAETYYNHLGELKYSKRSPVTDCMGVIEGMYYFQRLGLLVFYDKLKEQESKNKIIPELYQNRHVLRYEQRYQKKLSKSFNVERVTAQMLFDEAFYIKAIDFWKDNYFNIKKINDVSLNFEAMKGKKELYSMGVLALVEMQGGEINFISQINEACKSGKLSKRQAFEMRQAVTSACKTKDGITAQNEAILELDKKVMDAVKFYR